MRMMTSNIRIAIRTQELKKSEHQEGMKKKWPQFQVSCSPIGGLSKDLRLLTCGMLYPAEVTSQELYSRLYEPKL